MSVKECPRCKGRGKLDTKDHYKSTALESSTQCHVCGGSGVVPEVAPMLVQLPAASTIPLVPLLDKESQIRFNAYTLISRAVDEGVKRGYRRAHKHVEGAPSEEHMCSEIESAVMLQLCEILDFPEPFAEEKKRDADEK